MLGATLTSTISPSGSCLLTIRTWPGSLCQQNPKTLDLLVLSEVRNLSSSLCSSLCSGGFSVQEDTQIVVSESRDGMYAYVSFPCHFTGMLCSSCCSSCLFRMILIASFLNRCIDSRCTTHKGVDSSGRSAWRTSHQITSEESHIAHANKR